MPTSHREAAMVKRTLALSMSLVVALLTLLLVNAPSVAATPVAVRIDAAAQVAEDTDFTASVKAAKLTYFDAGQFDVSFDESMLRLDSATPGTIGTTEIPVVACNRIGTGKYRVIVNVPGVPGVSGSGTLVVLHYHVVGAAGSTTAIDLSNGFLNNNLGAEIAATWSADSVAICQGLAITTASLPRGAKGSAYSYTLQATGGNGSFSWSMGSRSLPDGLTLSADGVISGVPTRPGNYSFYVRVGDGQLMTSRRLSMKVTSRMGDINGDDQVNTSDITALERIIVEIDGANEAADVNQDGKTNTADVTNVEMIIVGLA